MFCGVLLPKWQHIGGSLYLQEVENKSCSFSRSVAIPPVSVIVGSLGWGQLYKQEALPHTSPDAVRDEGTVLWRWQVYNEGAVQQHCLVVVVMLISMPVALFAWDQAVMIRLFSQESRYLRVNKCDFSFIPSFNKHIRSAHSRHHIQTPHPVESKGEAWHKTEIYTNTIFCRV